MTGCSFSLASSAWWDEVAWAKGSGSDGSDRGGPCCATRRGLVVSDPAALHLQHQHAKVRVGDDEVRLAVVRRVPRGVGEQATL